MPTPDRKPHAGFSLLEVLVASAVLALLLSLLSVAVGATLSTIRHSQSTVERFASARAAFDRLTATLSQATLNTYWDYDDSENPQNYIRTSDLHFVIENSSDGHGQNLFFQSPLSTSGTSPAPSGLLNAVGYWVEFGEDKWRPPHVDTPRHRYRLMQGVSLSESFDVYEDATSAWTEGFKTAKFPIAENVIALILWPRQATASDPAGTALTGDYQYNSRTASGIQRHQLPPMVQATLIVLDEPSMVRIQSGATEQPEAIRSALTGKFQDVTRYKEDLRDVLDALIAEKINYTVLNIPVTLRESKWSSE
jgi:uncharacterized protein (TIGR02599 family)